jgi:hypothetical protein
MLVLIQGILMRRKLTSIYTSNTISHTDPIFKNIPGYDTVLLSHMIAFGACMVSVLLIVILYREGVSGCLPLCVSFVVHAHAVSFTSSMWPQTPPSPTT